MKRRTLSPSETFGPRAVFGFLSVAALPLLIALGCQGSLEGNFPAQSGTSGSGGSGSGGSGTGTGGSASGGSSGTGGSSGVACDVPNKVFKAYSCSTSGCHGGAGDTAPNLAASDVGAMLKSMNASIDCVGMKYIDPSNPKSSVVYKLVAGPDCDNDRMPLGNPLEGQELTDALTCLEDWISKQ